MCVCYDTHSHEGRDDIPLRLRVPGRSRGWLSPTQSFTEYRDVPSSSCPVSEFPSTGAICRLAFAIQDTRCTTVTNIFFCFSAITRISNVVCVCVQT